MFAGRKINIVTAYDPHVGCAMEEKEQFWEEMEEIVREEPSIERQIYHRGKPECSCGRGQHRI